MEQRCLLTEEQEQRWVQEEDKNFFKEVETFYLQQLDQMATAQNWSKFDVAVFLHRDPTQEIVRDVLQLEDIDLGDIEFEDNDFEGLDSLDEIFYSDSSNPEDEGIGME